MQCHLEVKPGVRLGGLRPEMLVALEVVMLACFELGHNCIITSGVEGKHSRGSEHYAGLALDFRLWHMPVDLRGQLVQTVRERVGQDFQVFHENVALNGEHLHVEYDPQTGVNQV